MNLVVFGPPGSGKGTQSLRICSYVTASVVDCGKLLRGIRLSQDQLKNLNSGDLLSDDFVIQVVKDKLSHLTKLGSNFILDGFPRSITQCSALFDMSSELEFEISCLVKFELSEKTVFERLLGRLVCNKCGDLYDTSFGKCLSCGSLTYNRRHDDSSAEAVKKRLLLYSAVERDIVDLFKSRGIKVLSIDADRSVDEVATDLRTQLLVFI
ncbi:adenylate kinase family protein [Neorickettsia helminthoeca str. Oregon]|uniref:Adenylate kinase n=1 Tax=Neorickettsia helminthoeca str. Oregon TaxID=1286528 RepID=X5HJH1_9RICK|nr:nucleoside monophosphate kinase [Neorickettsia helminthoeca]AHX11229.1 adenylate kinase family protein [Neorickettsia helminthoeca str. Oregon]